MSIKIVVPVSGGKDSQTCLKLAVSEYGPGAVLGLFCDTGWEHPWTYAHVERLKSLYGVDIRTVRAGTVEDKVRKHKRFPWSVGRFCTEELKINPSRDFYRDFAETNGGFEVWYGMRSGESMDRAKRYAGKVGNDIYPPHEVLDKYPKYLAKAGVMFRLPILEWSSADVFEYLGGEENPLYTAGFDRVGCFPCLASSPQNHTNAFEFDAFGAAQKQRVIQLERDIGKKHAPANTDQLCMWCQI